MTAISCRPFVEADTRLWDDFVRSSRNGTFLHERGYLSYHADRFPDASLIILSDGNPIALVPATVVGGAWVSHAGLTYGGLLVGRDFHAWHAVPALEAVVRHAREIGCARLRLKPVPHIYHRMPAEEDLYALFRLGAQLVRRDLAATLQRGSAYPRSKGRKWSVSKALKNGLEVRQSAELDKFMAIQEALLLARHGARPVHTSRELELLASRFPENIKLFAAYRGGDMVGGVVIYATDTVVHTQYIGATAEGKELGAVDAVVDFLLAQEMGARSWFDFGTSALQEGDGLDESLAGYKESWGARAIAYDHYELVL